METNNGFNINEVPSGTWIKRDLHSTIIGATTRSYFAFFLVPFTVLWSVLSLKGIYGGQITKGEFDLFKSIVGFPFLIGSVMFLGVSLMSIFGKVEITLDKTGGKVFKGIGNIGSTKQFNWNDVMEIKPVLNNINQPEKLESGIILHGGKHIPFGLGVSESRRTYLYQTMLLIHSNYKLNGYIELF